MKSLPASCGVLQPWGALNVDFLAAAKDTSAPADWLIHDSSASAAHRQSHFDNWFQSALDTLNHRLWPRYDPKRRKWLGDSVDWMEELTQADLDVMLEIQAGTQGIRRFDAQIVSCLRSLDWKTQGDLFGNEDELRGSNMFKGAAFYDRTLNDRSLAAISHLCFESGGRKAGSINERMKNHLQRPRPMQTALRYGRDAFEYREAGTSISPSMCSGHCLQGVTYVAALLDRLVTDGRNPAPETLQALATFGVDIGDRRVLAGVHYPADNLCSWLLFLWLSPFVYRSPAIVQSIANAIDSSYVLERIRAHSGKPAGSCYKPVLAELDRLLRAKCASVADPPE